MKKAWISMVSLALSILILLIGCLTAFAEQPKTNWAPKPDAQDAEAYVNGYRDLTPVYSSYDKQNGAHTFWIEDSKLHVVGWEFPTLTEGVDYEVISESGAKITIKPILKSPDQVFVLPYINVLVDNLDEVTATSAKENTQNQQTTGQKDAQSAKQKSAAQNSETQQSHLNKRATDTTASKLETELTTEPVSSQEPEAKEQDSVPVLPIVLVCVFAVIAAAAGITIYKRRKNNSID